MDGFLAVKLKIIENKVFSTEKRCSLKLCIVGCKYLNNFGKYLQIILMK